MNPQAFFDMLFYTVSHNDEESLSYMVSLLETDFGITISKQSLNERFNSKSEVYVKSVLSELLSEEFSKLYSRELLPSFTRIRIKDSTKFMVPTSLESRYKGCGGDVHSRSKAGISIQYEYDLKSGLITDLNISSGNRNDRTDSVETADNIGKGDLSVRDLGYFSTHVFSKYVEKEAFFLSRLDSSTNVYDTNSRQVSFKDIYASMQKGCIMEKEMPVYIGKETKLSVRLILGLVPEEVYEQRIREKTRKSKGQRRGQLTQETKIRSRFNLFITNAEESQLSSKQVFPLYRLRWQIELQFKIWKSVFKINSFREVKEHRYLTILYIKLLLIIINLQITYSLQQSFIQPNRDKIKVISLNKALKTLKTLSDEIFSMFCGTWSKARETAQYIQNKLLKNHWLESKKKKLCFPEILQLIICESEK